MTAANSTADKLTRQAAAPSTDLNEIIDGLSRPQKTLSPKFFYDQRGSKLFDQITELEEYYPTRTELKIMDTHNDEIVAAIGPRASLIEFGSGSSLKIRTLLKHLEDLAVYVPVEISEEFLVSAVTDLAADFPDIEILPVAADFTRKFDLPSPKIMPEKNVVYFPGSTIGNFRPDAAQSLLEVMRHEARDDGGLLIGVDLKKDKHILERAYDDSKGVTALFNLNMLVRLNREFGTNFDIQQFAHRAIYNEALGRIEMHLVSRVKQEVTLEDEVFKFNAGEYILSECSHKYTTFEFAEMALRAGFKVTKVWVDEDELFSLQYCEAV
ncbi:MAG: L-histidine N(alpha)-methyltransferase [Pseudomonadota bacterium]